MSLDSGEDRTPEDYPHFKGRVINHVKKIYHNDKTPPSYFLHKLRRDLSKYYKDLGYLTEVRNRDGYRLRKSCDFYYDKNLALRNRILESDDSDSDAELEVNSERQQLNNQVMVLKVYFSPEKAKEILSQ